MGESYYDLLGVSEDASTADIERAYREKLKETHPDVSDREDASERTKRLIEAKDTLTDSEERERYDRLGHENYVEVESAAATAGETSDAQDRTTGQTSASGRNGSGPTEDFGTAGSATGGTASAAGQSSGATTNSSGTTGGSWAKANGAGGQASTQGTTTGAAWNDRGGNASERSNENGVGTDRAWNRRRPYQVERGEDALRFGRALKSQRAMVLLGSTFLVYPVLLFGALDGTFPLPVNLTVAMCVVLVIAFLQSVPEVGIVVFGVWTLLLPLLLFGWLEADPLAFRSLASMLAVVFPFGLSILTRVAIRPMSAS